MILEKWRVLNALDELEEVKSIFEEGFVLDPPERDEALRRMTRALAILHALVKEK